MSFVHGTRAAVQWPNVLSYLLNGLWYSGKIKLPELIVGSCHGPSSNYLLFQNYWEVQEIHLLGCCRSQVAPGRGRALCCWFHILSLLFSYLCMTVMSSSHSDAQQHKDHTVEFGIRPCILVHWYAIGSLGISFLKCELHLHCALILYSQHQLPCRAGVCSLSNAAVTLASKRYR